MKAALWTAFVAALPSTALAQSPIFGLDLLGNEFYRTQTTDFVADYNVIGANSDLIRALDFDATATELWGIRNDTREFGTIDLATGVFSAVGTIPGTASLTGLTAASDGQNWYLCTFDDTVPASRLFVGNIENGNFFFLGVITSEPIIDISIDSQGNLYGYSISNDSLYSIDTTTGAGTLVGPLGVSVNGAQGMDFDWSTDTLYATLHQAAGTGVFARINVATGAADVLEDTTVLGAEMEMAVQVPAFFSTAYCFGDGTSTDCPCGNAGSSNAGCGNGSFASGAKLEATGPWHSAHLRITHGVPNQPVLFFEGQTQLNGGLGISFGDGLRCAGTNVVRLRTQAFDVNGEVTMTGSVQQNGGGAVGDERNYQGWYRDPIGSPCGSGFNLTNGVSITYPPLP